MTTSHEPLGVIPDTTTTDLPPRAPKRLMAAMALGNFGLWLAFFSPVIIAFPVKVEMLEPTSKEVSLALVLGVSSIIGILANPVIGRLSDRSLSRFGRRRPWILGSMLIGVIGLIAAGMTSNFGVFTFGVVLGAIGFAGGLSVLLALIPEHVPPQQRGSVAGLFGVSQAAAATIGVIVSGILVRQLPLAFIVPAVVGLLTILVLCFVLRERPITADERPVFGFRQFWGSFWTSPRKHPDFGWAWISRFAIFMAFATVVNYQTYYLTVGLHTSTATAAKLVSLGSVLESGVLIIAALVFGRLSDRVGRRRPFVFAASIIGVAGLALLAFNHAVPGFLLSLAIIGLAQGIYYSVDLALVAQILPNQKTDAGKNFGVFGIAANLPQSLAPVIAPLFLAIGSVGVPSNYTALFLGSAVFALIAGLTILRVRGAR